MKLKRTVLAVAPTKQQRLMIHMRSSGLLRSEGFRVRKFWKFFGAIQLISCRDW